ncbi:MAG: hypothetical protein QOF28_1095 [Actinomycetota bacterium]|nr:hypothetical protein [Actinomycetota bacterium]
MSEPIIGSIRPTPTDEEAAAITAAVVVLGEQRAAAAAAAAAARPAPERLNLWVDASRRAAQRAGLQRGPWRLSGRIARRSRT